MNQEFANTRVYLGLGSNLGNPVAQIHSACKAIGSLPGVRLDVVSGLYSSPPMGPSNQPDYVNAVAAIETSLAPHSLLAQLQAIELDHGRVRKEIRWGPRTLDIDILLYGDESIATPDLTVPHAGLSQRTFVLYPLQEIAPNLAIPGKGQLCDLVAGCTDDGLRRLL